MHFLQPLICNVFAFRVHYPVDGHGHGLIKNWTINQLVGKEKTDKQTPENRINQLQP